MFAELRDNITGPNGLVEIRDDNVMAVHRAATEFIYLAGRILRQTAFSSEKVRFDELVAILPPKAEYSPGEAYLFKGYLMACDKRPSIRKYSRGLELYFNFHGRELPSGEVCNDGLEAARVDLSYGRIAK